MELQHNDYIRKLCANLSEKLVEHRIGVHFTWEEREDGSEGLTEEAQDLFNETYDIVQEEIVSFLAVFSKENPYL